MDNVSSEMEFVANPDRARLCYQLKAFGIMGSMRGWHEDADVVHAVVELMTADPAQYRMAVVIAQAMGGEPAYAIEVMTARLALNPDDDLAKVVIGLAMLLVDHPDWKFALDNVLATSIDQSARQAALDMLDYAPALCQRAQTRAARAGVAPS